MPDVMKLPSSTTNGSALARVQAVSPGFRASLVQPFARHIWRFDFTTLRPFRFATRMGEPLGLTLATPDLAGQAGVFAASEPPNSISERNEFL
jgi:hypothetical protein